MVTVQIVNVADEMEASTKFLTSLSTI